MNPITNPIVASSAGNLVSQQSVTSKRTDSNKDAKRSDSTSGSIGDTLETSDREADGRLAYQLSSEQQSTKSPDRDSPVSGDNLDLHG